MVHTVYRVSRGNQLPESFIDVQSNENFPLHLTV